MKTYLVGGAVRDALLGTPTQDHDWVVVGSTPQTMIDAGYKPVGSDFPVFLHPTTHEEYALARTERKTARGYHGFQFCADESVTLEQDLMRRDLTINAMAKELGSDPNSFNSFLIDPYGGLADLKARVLRHVSPAFSEDPVRILRVARFAAQLGRPDSPFTVAPETLALMRGMVTSGEADALVAERMWQELARGLMCAQPERMLQVLRDCGLLQRILPELDARVDLTFQTQEPLSVRVAALLKHLDEARLNAFCERLRVPTDCRELAQIVAREHQTIGKSAALNAHETLQLLERCDALRRPERFPLILLACNVQGSRLTDALQAGLTVPAGTIADKVKRERSSSENLGQAIAKAIFAARETAIANAFKEML